MKQGWHRIVNVAIALAVVIALGVTLLPQPAQAAPDPGWYDASWAYRKQIAIDHAKVSDVTDPSTTYANFPLLVYATGLSNIKADGADIRFTSSDGTTELPREIESYSGGTLYAWVKVTLTKDSTDSSNDVIYMYYGNDAATEPASDSTYGSENVWSNGYAAVWHLHDDFLDSTQYDNDGTNSGSADDTGIIADAQYFDGSDDYVGVSHSSSLNITGAITVEMWLKRADMVSALPLDKNYSSSYYFYFKDTGAFELGSSAASDFEVESDAGEITADNWYYCVGTFDESTDVGKLYKNGDNVKTATGLTGTIGANTLNLTIGSYLSGGGYFFKGIIDEVRVSDMARSADWIKTCYNNQNSPLTFYDVGHEEEKPGASCQRWYLSSTAGSWVMYKGDHTKTAGTVTVADDGSEIWIANEAATVNVAFPANTWTGHITFDAGSLDTTVRVYVGKWDDSIFTPSAEDEYADVSSSSDFSILASSFTVPETKWLAFKMEDQDPLDGDLNDVVVSVGGNNSYLTSGASDPGYPIPELPTIILLGMGLACLGGYIVFMRRKRRGVSP